jgi:hypothetical protein
VFPDSLEDLAAGKTVTLKYEGKYPVGVVYNNETFLVDWHVPTKTDEQGQSVPNLEWDWNVKQRPHNPGSREAWSDPEEMPWTITTIEPGYRGLITIRKDSSGNEASPNKPVEIQFENLSLMGPQLVPGMTYSLVFGLLYLPLIPTQISSKASANQIRYTHGVWMLIINTMLATVVFVVGVLGNVYKIPGVDANATTWQLQTPDPTIAGDDWISRAANIYMALFGLIILELSGVRDTYKMWLSRSGQASFARCSRSHLATDKAWNKFSRQWMQFSCIANCASLAINSFLWFVILTGKV